MKYQTAVPRSATAPVFEKPVEESPFVEEFFMIEALGYRGMAYCDATGKWHKAFDHAEIFGEIYVLE